LEDGSQCLLVIIGAPIRGAAKCAEETLLIEWPAGEAEPTKYWLATVDPKMSFRGLVDIVKMRGSIERDYQDLKQEIGLGHYEGRGWQGFHHHGTLSIAAYGFLVLRKGDDSSLRTTFHRGVEKPALLSGYRPGCPDLARTPRPKLDRHDPALRLD
jgi:hypothetical protein